MRLGQAERPQHLAFRQRHQPLLLLLFVSESHADTAHWTVVHRNDGRGAAITGGDLFQYQGQRQIVEASTAQLLRHGHAKCAEFGQLSQRVSRKLMLAVPASGMRCELLLRKIAQRVADHLMLF